MALVWDMVESRPAAGDDDNSLESCWVHELAASWMWETELDGDGDTEPTACIGRAETLADMNRANPADTPQSQQPSTFKRFVEVGRVVLVNDGPSAGKLAVIAEIIDHNRALIDGPTTSVPRQQIPYRNLILTPYTLASLPRAAGSGPIKKAIEKAGVMEKWEQSGWAKKLAARQVRKVGDTVVSPRSSLLFLDEPVLVAFCSPSQFADVAFRTPPTLTASRSSSRRSLDGISSARRTSRRRRPLPKRV
jgi:large subunit ribosomal protein L14e